MPRHGQVPRIVIGVTSVVFCINTPFQVAEAYAFSRHHSGRWDRPKAVVVLPRRAVPLRFGDGSYYYCEGRYYKHSPRGYVVIPAPVGVMVPNLPEPHRTIVMDGVMYYEYDGVYYKGGPVGYTVVPMAQATPGTSGTAVVASASAPAPVPSATVVNVPNKNGSYTPVSLQLAHSGMYIGPQGEVYPNLPTVQQLQSLYGK